MSSELLVSRPHFDTRQVAHGLSAPPEAEETQPSAGSATAGYRSAKYSPAEWLTNYRAILRHADADGDEARSVQRDSKSLSQLAEADTQRAQARGMRRLGERLQDVHLWRPELQRHIELMRADTDALMALKRRLEKALDATEIPYAIAADNLSCRGQRPGPDLVRDAVEEELLKEVDLIKSIQTLLKSARDQVVNQIKINKDAKLTLELDWSDKHEAYNFDDHSGRLTNMSPDAKLHPSSATVQEQVCNPPSWAKFSQDNLSKATQADEATGKLRLLVERMLQETTQDLAEQCSSVDQAFSQRCEELIQARTQLELQHAETLEQIAAQEKNIVALLQAIHNKEAPLRVVQSRLYLRSLRPNMELCRDQPQLSLEGEAQQLDATLESLRQQLAEARGSLSRLEESRMALEKDIACKNNSLFIEREKCMSHRRRYPTVTTLTGY